MNIRVRLTEKPKQIPKAFQVLQSVSDEKSFCEEAPKNSKLVLAGGMYGGRYVPVSFVAKDWNVTSRRIRALLSAGRLLGRVQDNGYWEVHFPYSFTFGTRGPCLKRQQKPVRQRKKPELRAV
jgi:hypothetical protein